MKDDTNSNSKEFFELKGLAQETERLKTLLQISSPMDHILIKGPRGAGKSYFTKVFIEHYPDQNKPYEINCAAIHPSLMASELFGHVKGAFTGATENKKGIIETAGKNKQPILLEEFNSLAAEHQAQLLVFLETGNYMPVGSREVKNTPVRIIATMNYETESKPRFDIMDRFKVVIDVPPLYLRRHDILTIIAQKYPSLKISTLDLLTLYFYNWPGNVRELDQILFEMKAGLGIRKSLQFATSEWLRKVALMLLSNGLHYGRLISISKEVFNGLIPLALSCDDNFPTDQIMISMNKHTTEAEIKLYGPDNTEHLAPEGISRFLDLVVHGDAIKSKESIFELEPFNFSEMNLVFARVFYDSDMSSDIYSEFFKACENVLSRKAKQVTPDSPKEITPDQVIDYILTLGKFEDVERFLFTKCRDKFHTIKALANHWGLSPSTLRSKIKKRNIAHRSKE